MTLAAVAKSNAPLEELTLDGVQLGDESMLAMMQLPWFRCEGTDLFGKGITASVLATLLNEDRVDGTWLSLTANPIGDQGAEALRHWRRLPQLEHLSLDETGIGAAGLRMLLVPGAAPSLTNLSLARNELDDECFEVLAQWPQLARLESLDLTFVPLSSGAVTALLESPYIRGVEKLELFASQLSNEDLERLERGANVYEVGREVARFTAEEFPELAVAEDAEPTAIYEGPSEEDLDAIESMTLGGRIRGFIRRLVD